MFPPDLVLDIKEIEATIHDVTAKPHRIMRMATTGKALVHILRKQGRKAVEVDRAHIIANGFARSSGHIKYTMVLFGEYTGKTLYEIYKAGTDKDGQFLSDLAHASAIKPFKVDGKHIIVPDDIKTSIANALYRREEW